jgi:hypothetical protein
MSSLVVPTGSSIRQRRDAPPIKMVEGDVFNIAARVKMIDPSLSVLLQEGHPKPWVVVETNATGEHMVQRYERLDPEILEDLRRMAAIPFEKRYRELADAVDAENTAPSTGLTDEQFELFAWNLRKNILKYGLA